MGLKRSRPRTSHFAVHGLVDKWQALVELRDPGFNWDGSSYPKGNKAVNIDALEAYARPLQGLLEMAPSGFPSHGDLRNTLSFLQSKYGIFSRDKRVTQRTCDEAAEAWRLMAKHIYNIKKAGTPVGPSLQLLVGTIALPKREGDEDEQSSFGASNKPGDELSEGCPRPSPSRSSLGLKEVEEMFHVEAVSSDDDDDRDEVELLEMRCACEECVQRGVKAKSLGTIVVDVEEHKRQIPVANPIAGQQRQETAKALARRRYRTKATPRTLGETAPTTAKNTKKKQRRPLDLHKPILLPLKLVHRQSGKTKPEAYLLSGGNKYVAGQSSASNSSYLEDMKALKAKIEANEIGSAMAARLWLKGLRRAAGAGDQRLG